MYHLNSTSRYSVPWFFGSEEVKQRKDQKQNGFLGYEFCDEFDLFIFIKVYKMKKTDFLSLFMILYVILDGF
jgi:hypothetical protein